MFRYKINLIIFFLIFCVMFGYSINLDNLSSGVDILFNVSIVGAIKNPGVYKVLPETRLSEVYKQANIETIQQVEKFDQKQDNELDEKHEKTEISHNDLESNLEPSMRNIVLKRGLLSIEVDLLKFLHRGDYSNNPYLHDGDIIVVPALNDSVFIYGAINKRGAYELVKGDKILDIIELSLGLTNDAYLGEAEIVRFTNEQDSTEIIKVNLGNIISNPDFEENEILKNDDRIFIRRIPEYHKKNELKVNIFGAIKNPGTYEITEGFNLYDLVVLAGGLLVDAHLQKVDIVRFIEHQDSTETIEVNFESIINNPEINDNLILKNDDRIFIRSIKDYHKVENVKIFGEVQFPGVYNIQEDITTLSQILIKAGGPTYRADAHNSFLQRKSKEDILDPEFERLKKMLIDDMSDFEYEYFKAKSRELRGKFSVNFDEILYKKNTHNLITLKSNDYIYISSKSTTISVSGQVKKPGLIPFVSGMNYLYYLDQSGGYSWNAWIAKSRIIKANTGEWIKPSRKTLIEKGDLIFVPEKKDINYWQLTKDIMKIIAEIATVVIVVQNLK